jgi:hypothetical protein
MKRRIKQQTKEGTVTVVTTAAVRPPVDAVSRRAREIWMARGQPQGCDEEIWLTAERQIAEEMSRGLPPLEERGLEVPAEEVENLEPRVNEAISNPTPRDRHASSTSLP